MFVKLYETDQGQILVKLDTCSEEYVPEVRFYVEPPGLGVCSIALKFKDDDEGWDKAEEVLRHMSEEQALKVVQELFDTAADMM